MGVDGPLGLKYKQRQNLMPIAQSHCSVSLRLSQKAHGVHKVLLDL